MILSQNVQVVNALSPDADRYNADSATDVINMENYDHVTFILQEGVGATGTVTLTVEECTAIDGTGATAIAFKYRACTTGDTFGALTAATTAGFTTTAGSNHMYLIELDAQELSSDSPFVRVQLTEVVDSPVDAGVLAICSGAKYKQAIMPTAIA